MTIRPGLCSVTFRALPPAAVIGLAAEAGLAAIEWGGDVHVPPGDLAHARAVAAATRAAGLAVSSYGSYLRPPTATAAEVDAVLATAEALGAPLVRVWPGARDRPSATYDDAERAAVADAIAAIADRAAARGLAVGLEFHPGTLTDDTASAERLMAALTSAPNVALYWQPRPGLAEADGLAEIARLGRHIADLHVFHWDARSGRHPLADAVPTWRRWCEAVVRADAARPRTAMLEFVAADDPGRFREDAAALRAIVAGRW